MAVAAAEKREKREEKRRRRLKRTTRGSILGGPLHEVGGVLIRTEEKQLGLT